MIKEAILKLSRKEDLDGLEMQAVMFEILSGSTDIADIISFLASLADKGETVEELTAAVEVMLKHVDPIVVDRPHILDTCGTGGDTKGTFNISTITALVASGAGCTVAKHGNRSVSSKCGSADLLEALGVTIAMDKATIKRCLEECGIAFLFAPALHPAMKHVMPARKQMARKTMFNLMGPLINPARATNQLIGVYSREWIKPLAQVLHNLGTEHVMVVHGEDGLDEVTITGTTFVAEVKEGSLSEYEITPEAYGFRRQDLKELICRDIAENVAIATDVVSGKRGVHRDTVLLNAGCAIYVANKAPDIRAGIVLATESIDSGKAMKKLELLKEYSRG